MVTLRTFVFVAIFISSAVEIQSNNNGGYLFVVPKYLRSGKRETACLSLHGAKTVNKAEVTVTINSNDKEASAVTKKIFDAENVGCFEIRVPEIRDNEADIFLQVKFANETNITEHDKVKIVQNTGVTFVQTDKKIYKPGDRVKIRILILNHDLGISKQSTIPYVKIWNPSNIAIGQWENVTTELGLVQLEHQLSSETVVGRWRIELPSNNNAMKTFEVKEYVLPRFEVIVDHLETIYVHADNYNFTVCAKYSYGRAVKGTAHIKLEMLFRNFTVNQIKELKNGCAVFSVDRSNFPIHEDTSFYVYSRFELTATVTEQGTGQMQIAKSDIQFSDEKYSIQFINCPEYFQPGIPYTGQVEISNKFNLSLNKTLKLCYNFGIFQSYNLLQETCKNITLNNTNLVDFTILPFDVNAVTLNINAVIQDTNNESLLSGGNYPGFHRINKWNSPTNSYIYISYESISTPIKCKAWQTFTILYTLNTTTNTTKHSPITFHYVITSKGNIMKFGKVSHTPCSSQLFDVKDYKNVIGNTTNAKTPLSIDKFILTIKVHQKMFSEAKMLVYYVRDDDEVVGNYVNFKVENCLSNKVEANWSENQNYPGEKSVYKIKSSAGSLCAVSVVDKKVSLLSEPDNLSFEKLLRQVQKPYVYEKFLWDCLETNNGTNPYVFWDLKRRKRSYSTMFGLESMFDVMQTFHNVELLVKTNLKTIFKPCHSIVVPHSAIYYDSPAPSDIVEFSGSPYHTQAADNGVPVRTYFPETWLWDLVPVGRSGEIRLEKELPHSITNWVSNTFCVSPSTGIGISQPSIITTFKPFFIDIITPYSLKRNEVTHLKIIVYNYLNHSLPVAITLGLNSGMRLAGSPEESFITTCIGPNDSITDTFRVIATDLGKMNFSVTAEVDSAYPGECGPEIIINRKDILVKNIIVQPEGFPFERTISNFVCADDMSNDTLEKEEMKWNIEVPYDSIKNSSRLKILLDTDLLELTIENLGSLLHIPTGCGEQIMSTLAPNIYVLRYLKSTGNSYPNIENKALNYIKIGYEKIINYRHRDGSFSAFGEKYSDSSMFLTAFVMRTLAKASEYVYIDKFIITTAANWILEKQFENGCFPKKSHVFQSGIADESDQDNIALSAYVLISLMESGLPISDKVRDNAKYCLRSYNSADKYTMSIITYGLSIVNWENEASRSLDRMLEIANRKNGLLWWEENDSLSNNVEMTSYVILSLIHSKNSQRIALAHEAVRWLLTKRNSFGGFVSTQDTVVALDALTKFALITNKENVDLNVAVATGGKQFSFRMRNKAKLKTKQITLTKFSNFIKFKINGTGCILIQTFLKYNMAQYISSEALKLAVSVNSVSTIDKCTITQVTSCLSYAIPNKHINMAVMEISLPSGYRADRASLFELLKSDTAKVQRFEEVEDKVIFYFVEVTDEKLCIPFLIHEEMYIENRTDTAVRLYDYYNPGVSTSTSYKLSYCNPIDLSN